MRILSILLILLVSAQNGMCEEPRRTSFDAPEGVVELETTTIEPTPQEISTVTGKELKTLERLDHRGPELVSAYLPDVRNPNLKDYDEAFRLWQADNSKRYTNQEIVEILGSHLGNKCVAELSMEWVLVTDQYGTDYAVRGKTAEVTAFPFSTVWKRIERGEHDFMYPVYHAIRQTLESGDYQTRNPEEGSQ